MYKKLKFSIYTIGLIGLIIVGSFIYSRYFTKHWAAVAFNHRGVHGEQHKFIEDEYWNESDCVLGTEMKLKSGLAMEDGTMADGFLCGKSCFSDAFAGTIQLEDLECTESSKHYL